ncbi:MAG: PKD domain-containing protein [Flavobacteriales bacterium]|nr:PKD domain-containing protein [Flavobacteriales bacterium]
MKKLSLTLALLSVGIFSYAQQKADASHSTPVPVTFHGVTGRLDQFVEAPGTVNEITKTEKIGYHPKNDWGGNQFTNPNALPNGDDPVWQQDYAPPAPPTKILGVGWNGMAYTGVNPADPSVDVGPNHVVQMINGGSGSYIQVYSKTGTPIGSQVYFDNFMSLPGGAGDPIVMYDERANRWFLSEFSQTGNNLHIAISTTPDPGGTYYTYSFNSPGGFPDYPKYSIWENEYVMTANVGTPDIFAFNRTVMLTGAATTAQMFSQSNFGTIGFQASTPVSMNGTATPPAGQPALLMRMRDDAWTGSASDALEMWELDVDWVTPANSTLSQVQVLGTAPHDSELCGYTSFQCFPQPGTGTVLDPLRELLMNRIHYRNFGTHESIVCCHVTDVNNTDRGGVRWYELRRTGGTAGSWAIYQQGTYSPDATNRWMPSISISASGNIGIAYSAASGTVFPSLRYTGRKECDPLGTMTEPETVLIAGTASNQSNRWGDYFQLNCDPSDGETFWHTGCFNTSAQWSTRVSSFDIPTCSPQVSFAANSYSVDEGNGTTINPSSACLPYIDVIIPISMGSAPSQDGDIVVSVTGGTATIGVDFDLINGTTTLNSANLSSDITIRVYNDALVEGNETVVLTYTLNANGGNAAAGSINQSVTITINDDDLTPTGSVSTSIVLSENFESGFGGFSTSNNGTPAATAWQVGNNAAATSGAYAIPTTNTTSFAWINDDACNCDQNDVDFVFPTVNLTNYTGGSLTFSTYFEDNTYQGDNENADVYVSINGAADVLVGPLVASTIDLDWTAQNFDITPYVGNANVIFKVKYSDATGWLYGCTIDDVVITGVGTIGIQTAINTGTGTTADLGPNEIVHFYDPTSGDVMLTIDNSSSFDYGCVTVEVDRPGTTPTAAQFNTANTADYLHSKTFTIVPQNTNPSGSYDVTLYYEDAEVTAWETATGNSRNNAEIVKVDGTNQISDVTPATAGSYTVSSAASILGAFGGDVTFTSSFSTGFSGFGVGIYNAVLGTPPVANFSATSTTICAGESVSFTDLSTNTPTSWSWNFGDAGTATTQNPAYVYTTAGTYTVILTATNANGSDGNTITNYITVNAIPSVVATGTATICAGQSTTITGSGATTYSWNNGAGTNASATVSPTSTTTYTVTGMANGCTNTDQVTVTVTPLPSVVATGTATICAGLSTTMVATGATSYSWDNGAGTNASATVSPTSTTTYTVTGTTNGCTNTTQVTITVDPTPVIALGTVSNPNVCATTTGSIQITGTGSGNVTWTGTTSGNANAVTLPYTVTGLTAGSYTVSFTSTVGCASNSLTQSLSDPTPPPILASGTATICAGQSTVLSATGATSYSWNNGAGTNASATVSPTTTTTYTVTGTTNGCAATDQVTVTVTPLPSVVATGTATICSGQSATMVATGATSYSWDNGAGTNASATVSPTTTTSYTVTGTTNGCANTDQVTITVNATSVIALGTVSNPNVCATTTGSIQITGTGSGNVTWTGTASGNANAVTLPYTVTGLTAGSYTVSFTSTVGCVSNSVTQSLSDPTPPPISASGTATICAGQSTVLSATGATSYLWDNGAGTNASATVSPTTTTTYTVTGTTNGCAATDQVTVTVTPLPSVVATGTGTICEGQSATMVATGATTYSWDNGAGTNASATVSPTSTTTYTVTGTTSGCTNTDQVTISVNAATSSTQDVEICEGSSYTVLTSTYTAAGTYTDLTLNAAGCDSTIITNLTVNPNPTVSIEPTTIDTLCTSSASITLVGTPGAGTFSGTGVTGSVFDPLAAGVGSHTITYSFTDGNGCSGSTSVIAIVEDCTNGIQEVGLEGVSLFPNPNEGIFMITGLTAGTEYEIYDDRGRLVSAGVTESEEQEVQLLNVQTGIYYLYASQNGQKGSLKFLITK